MDLEDMRKKRLAFFGSKDGLESDLSKPKNPVLETETSDRKSTSVFDSHQGSPDIVSYSKSQRKNYPPPIGYDENVEQLLRSVKKELYGNPDVKLWNSKTERFEHSAEPVKNSKVNSLSHSSSKKMNGENGGGVADGPKSLQDNTVTDVYNKSKRCIKTRPPNIDHVLPEMQKATTIEGLFTSSHRSGGEHPDLLSESQNFDNISVFQKSVDLDNLGLSTHRPESDRRLMSDVVRTETNPEDMSITEDLRNVLSESKYREFIAKSKDDIQHLKQDSTLTEGLWNNTEDNNFTRNGMSNTSTGKSENEETSYRIIASAKGKSPGGDSNDKESRPEGRSYGDGSQLVENLKFRPKLYRPKEQPVQIDRNNQSIVTSPVPVKFQNYEQVVVSRNVAYHTDEIYRQAENVPAQLCGGIFPSPPQQHPPGMYIQPASHHSVDIPQGMPPSFYGYCSPQIAGPMMYDQFNQYHILHPPNSHIIGGYAHSNNFSPRQLQNGRGPMIANPIISPHNELQPSQVFNQLQFMNQFLPSGQPQMMNQPYHMGQLHVVEQQPVMGQYSPYPNYQGSTLPLQEHPTGANANALHMPIGAPVPHPPASRPTHNERRKAAQRHVDGVRQHHQHQKQQQEQVEVPDEQSDEKRNYAEASLERYFSSLDPQYIPEAIDENDASEISQRGLTTDEDKETLIQTDITVGGITDKMENLGIDISSFKILTNVKNISDEEVDKHLTEIKVEGADAAGDGQGKSIRSVITCPECSAHNKTYMTWCGSCGEVLIGVQPVMLRLIANQKTGKQNYERIETSADLLQNYPKVDGPPSELESINDKGVGIKQAENKELQNANISGDEKNDDGQTNNRPDHTVGNVEKQFYRTRKEVVDICETIQDPVIRGYVKSHFTKKREAVLNSREKSVQSEQHENLSKNKESSTQQKQRESSDGLALDLNVEDSISDFSRLQDAGKKQKKVSRKKHGSAIDLEIFGIEERKEVNATCSSRNPDVPILNLVDSSDEEVGDIDNTDESTVTQNSIPHQQAWGNSHSASLDTERNHQFISDESPNRSSKFDVPVSENDMWKDLFQKNSEEPADEVAEYSEPFLAQLLDEKKSKVNARNSVMSAGKGRSKASVEPSMQKWKAKGNVRDYIDGQASKRHWAHSSMGLSSYSSGELYKSSPNRRGNRPSSGSYGARQNASVDRDGPTRPSSGSSIPRKSASADNVTGGRMKARPSSADYYKCKQPKRRSAITDNKTDTVQSCDSNSVDGKPVMTPGRAAASDVTPLSYPFTIEHRLPLDELPESVHAFQPDKVSAQNAYSRYLEMTPRLMKGNFSRWLLLPDELLLHIFFFLPLSDLARCAQVCKHFYRVAMDESLWRYITVRKNHDINDDNLSQIGKHHPVSLALIQCHGDNVSSRGLRQLFLDCADTLKELNFSCCSHGSLIGDSILLHAAAHCYNLTHVDASWCNVTDSGVMAISQCCKRLESLCINGCQSITDEGFETMIKKHAQSLRVLEMFGCFSITPRAIRFLSGHCQYLQTLNLGQCYKLKDEAISQLSACLGWVETLDLRGCRHIKDNCMRRVVKNCPHLHTIALANCPNISDVALLEISTYLSGIRSIDVCGCKKVTDTSIRALANNCQQLHSLDISSTGCSHRSVSMLANFCNQSLKVVKLNFLADVTEACLIKLARHCKRLQILHVFGCPAVKNIARIQAENQKLTIEL